MKSERNPGGRPKAKEPTELMAFRFKPKTASEIRGFCEKKGIPQVRALEEAWFLYRATVRSTGRIHFKAYPLPTRPVV